MRIVITGSKGQLGTALQARLAGHTLLLIDLPEVDITSASQVQSALQEFAPDVVIHAAAMTDVDRCETEPDLAYRINALGTQNVALACQRSGAAMAYISTDYVFDGSKGAPYYEFDATAPLSIYAKSKLAGEWFVQSLLQRFYIVRTAWVFMPGHRNFVETVFRLAQERGTMSMVTDEVGSPTYAPDLADALARLLPSALYGIYHFTNSGTCSRYEWAREILQLAGLNSVHLAPSENYQRPAPVPRHVELRNLCGAGQLGITLRPWQEALASYIEARP